MVTDRIMRGPAAAATRDMSTDIRTGLSEFVTLGDLALRRRLLQSIRGVRPTNLIDASLRPPVCPVRCRFTVTVLPMAREIVHYRSLSLLSDDNNRLLA